METCQEFIARLNERFHNAGWRYRLPTEAEWEYSCREGASSPAACSFHFYLDRQTNDLSSAQANFDGKSPDGAAPEGKYLQRPTKVGSYKANGLGLYDMHGNVWEWCQDRWEEGGSNRVLRGGKLGQLRLRLPGGKPLRGRAVVPEPRRRLSTRPSSVQR